VTGSFRAALYAIGRPPNLNRKLTNCHSSLGRVCHYGLISPSPSATSETFSTQLHRRASSPKVHLPSLWAWSGIGRTPDIDAAITSQLSNAVGNIENVRKVAVTYFGSIHYWLPIISVDPFNDSVRSIFLQPRADTSLLCLAIALITSNLSEGDYGEEDKLEKLYTLCKTSIAFLEAKGVNSLEVVQARLLVALFEVGHWKSAAYISIAALARVAVEIGINRSANAGSEERYRVWWGIVMLDRYGCHSCTEYV
jgi:hypothetical protein